MSGSACETIATSSRSITAPTARRGSATIAAIEVSGYHHNVAYDFLSLRPALYASGDGEVRFRNFKYRALP